ncbi:BLUF domain-containing protein [Chitinolyticbacter meiyuanensis]|uniref:BLUF domain-containing protein n=1 Tax=Chitinolyticbacter meiyuanensis TaxID=682798 RepID=UPI0011E5B09D|nr:BLUF domain-containing protein [Chitinolyticbacter meiyuanensis]
MLVRLIYASRAAATISAEAIEAILVTSRQNNADHGITGVLCYTSDVFVQAIEGGREQVNTLYNRLQRDARHHDLVLLDYTEIASRRYAAWSMGKLRLDKINLSLLLKYSPTAELDPYTMPGPATAALLEELAATASFCG